MGTLILFNFLLIFAVTALLITVRKWASSERAGRVVLLVAPLVTILFHYSMLFYHLFVTGDALWCLGETPNLILPMYPCNVVMWCCLFYGLLSNKECKLGRLLSDYIFWFGILSTLVGMFANVDFIENPTLSDFEVTKSIIAHATLLFNVLLIPVLGYLRPSFSRNLLNMTIAVVAMYVIGLYCNLVFGALASPEVAYDQNAMFILHSPFEGLPFLRYPLIATLGLLLYCVVFTVCDILTTPRGSRWFDCVRNALRKG